MLNKSTNNKNSSIARIGDIPGRPKQAPSWKQRVPWLFVCLVLLPTLIASVYFGLIARPVYVSESQFIVRSQKESTPNALGLALQGIGLTNSASDSFLAHSYIKSRYALETVSEAVDITTIVPKAGDLSQERLFKKFQKRIVVGVNASDGISTVRVRAFTPEAAQKANEAMMNGAEKIINDLNVRSTQNTLQEAEETYSLAQRQMEESNRAIAEFRRSNQTVDPVRMATENGQLIGGLMLEIAQAKARRAQLASEAPNSPMLPQVDAQIRALETQLASEKANLTRGDGSVANQISAYEELVLNREIAERALGAAKGSLEEALIETRRQKLYLDRIVPANLPDEAMEPRRLYSIFLTLLTSLLIYGVVALLWASIKEHRQK